MTTRPLVGRAILARLDQLPRKARCLRRHQGKAVFRQPRVKGTRLTVEHLLNGLTGHSELTGDIGLGQAILDEHPHQVAALNCQRSRLACVFDGPSTDLFDAIENLFAGARVMFHQLSLKTVGCRCQPGVVSTLLHRRIVHASGAHSCRLDEAAYAGRTLSSGQGR